MKTLLTIKNLTLAVAGQTVIDGLDLEIACGEVHAMMGLNGSGKSTLAYALAGHPDYEIASGQIIFDGVDLLELEPHQRARAGLFLAFQYPVEIPGVTVTQFLKELMMTHQTAERTDLTAIYRQIKQAAAQTRFPERLLKRDVNSGFSGGEKKQFDILQMQLLEPQMAILDETDSGLDIDALRHVADGINRMRSENRGFLLITHYQRLLGLVKPDMVHILNNGKIVKSGDYKLALDLERLGYSSLMAVT